MKKNIVRIIIGVVAILVIAIGIMYLVDLDRMKKGEEVVFSTWGAKYSPPIKINQNEKNNNNDNNSNNVKQEYQKYTKIVDNVKLEINIPNDWKYEEIVRDEDNDFYKYALKFYKTNEEEYAILYFYHDLFGVCGTERTSENIILDNGENAIIGYYDGNENWSDISFYSLNQNIAVINYGLIGSEANEVIEFIKTININNIDE